MERSRESRKASMAASVGVSRRRHRGSGLRDSPDEDGPVELQETGRLRDRKKERERERERDRERSSRNKRRRGDRLMHAGNREDRAVDSTEESVNDEDEEDYEDGGIGSGSLRMPPPNPASNSSPSLSNHHQNQHRKSFPQPNNSTKMLKLASTWKPVDEMIGVPIPRKARSASTKRAHDCWVSGSSGLMGGGDQLHRQASTSPARSSLVSATASPLRMSPPSSNLYSQKKMKVIGSNKNISAPKYSASKTTSLNQEEIEFEIAEVLYGMMTQPSDATKGEGDLNEGLNKSTSDSKSRVSSPVLAVVQHQSSTGVLLKSGMVSTVPKRKRPRPVNYGDENVGFPSRENIIGKSDVDSVVKAEPSSAFLEKNFKPELASCRASPDLEQSRDESTAKSNAVLMIPFRNNLLGSEILRAESTVSGPKDVDAILTKRDSPLKRFDENGEENIRSTATVLGIKREEKFQIDLMAPPPASRLSPDRDGNVQYVSSEPNKSMSNLQELKHVVVKKAAADDSINLADSDHNRFRRGSEVQKASFSKERYLNIQLTAPEKNDRENGMAVAGSGKQEMLNQHHQGQPLLPRISSGDEAAKDKIVPAAGSLPSAMSVAGWQGGLPPLGYMTPLQGVVHMEGSTLSSTPIQPPHMLLNQPRPKRCATHCYIAQSISCHQQFTRMNPFWPGAAGSAAALYGANPCNLKVVPPIDLHSNTGGRGVNPVPDNSLGVFPGSNTSKDKPSQALNIPDTQRKQILLQQSVPSGVPGNLLQGQAFMFPLSQQQAAAAAASALTTAMKIPLVAGASPSVNLNSGPGSAPTAAPATMTFNYPNMATNETQYMAILQNNSYQFPFPTHAGAPPVYRGAHPQALPFFNGAFYSPQMLHPSQFQQQLQQTSQGHQVPPGQNMGISSGSSIQKHMQIHSQKSQGNGCSSGGTANMKQSYPSPKGQGRPSHLPLKQHSPHLADMGSEDSPSTADSRGSRSNLGMYTEGLNFPIHAQNFALMSASSISAGGVNATINGVATGNAHKNGNHTEKKPHQQQHGLKVSADPLPSHQGFAVSFASLNGDGTPPALDITSIGQNHAILQNFPKGARHHSYQVMAASQAPQSKKNSRITEEVKKASNGDASNIEDERQSLVSKGVLPNVGLSIAFSRSDLADSSPGNNVVDSSPRNLKVGSGPGRAPGPILSNSMTNTQQHLPHHHQQLQQSKAQLIQLYKQPQHYMASAPRGKTQSSSNGNVYSDQMPTNAAMTAKLTNSLSTFQKSQASLNGGANSPTHSQQWKQSPRASVSQVPSPVLAPTNSASTKNIYQQQSHMQISFGGSNPKALTTAQGQHPSIGHKNQAQLMVGSVAASINHRSSGSPRTSATAGMVGMVSSKAPQATTLSPSAPLQVKNSTMPSRSSSPVGARIVPPALGNSNMCMPQSISGSKPQMFQQQQQVKQQLSKQGLQPSQFPSYLQTSQGPNPTSTAASVTAAAVAVPNNGYPQRRMPDAQQSQQQSQSPSGSSSTGMLSMCSSSVAVTTDPAKAIADAAAAAAAGNNTKALSK